MNQGEFWSEVGTKKFRSEAEVELLLVLPLLDALGYKREDISPKHPIDFQTGRVGRKHEADFVTFYGPRWDRETSLVVVEAKPPTDSVDESQAQVESYAQNIRAPIFVSTNGIELRIWQTEISTESRLILASKVSDLRVHRAEVEATLSKAVVVELCRRLLQKSIVEVSGEIAPYISVEIRRTTGWSVGVDRTLSEYDGHGSPMPSSGLFDRGSAIISAPSGYGKSVLSRQLHAEALARFWTHGERLPIYVYLPDFENSNESDLIAYCYARITPHLPAMSDTMFRSYLGSKGGVLVCDAFDRVSASKRPRVESGLRDMLRDFPTTRLFVFSKQAVAPTLGLPRLQLLLLNAEEKEAFRQQFEGRKGADGPRFWPDGPLESLTSYPLLFELILEYAFEKNHSAETLPKLFDGWLASLLGKETTPSARVKLESVLTNVAKMGAEGLTARSTVIAQLIDQGVATVDIDVLIEMGALVISGDTLDLPHEALGDYLRARAISGQTDAIQRLSLKSVELKPDSLFAQILLSLIRSEEGVHQLLSRILDIDLTFYVECLAYCQDGLGKSSVSARNSPAHASEYYLERILKGIEEPLTRYFSPLSTTVATTLIGEPSAIGISGHVIPGKQLVYRYAAIDPYADRVTKRSPGDMRGGQRFMNLTFFESINARQVGASDLATQLKEIIKARLLKGGLTWWNDRLVGFLRLLADKAGLTAPDELTELRKILLPHAGERIETRNGIFREAIGITEILAAVASLESEGEESVNRWPDRFGLTSAETLPNAALAALLDEHFRRLQLIYKEIVDVNFPELRHQLSFYGALPVRYQAWVAPGEFGSMRLAYTWMPVIDWTMAGADVSFGGEDIDVLDSWQATKKRLDALGRNFRSGSYMGRSILPTFSGASSFRGRPDDTSALADACGKVSSEIGEIFNKLPGGSW